MWHSRLNLLRYLFVCRINSPFVFFQHHPSVELSLALGQLIAERLPTAQARPWHKTLAEWKTGGGNTLSQRKKKSRQQPENPWPLEAALLSYPTKRNLSEGEYVFWELKLIGASAEHGLFLETILPAFEHLGYAADSRWRYANCFWGHFDIQAVYMARGRHWEPLVEAGRLHLDYPAGPRQWAEGLVFEADLKQPCDYLTWVTPYEPEQKTRSEPPPSLKSILDALVGRMNRLLSGKHLRQDALNDFLDEPDRTALKEALELAAHIPVLSHDLNQPVQTGPGRWIGRQTFSTAIPEIIRPLLGIASIFHIGGYTHYGCGTFAIN